MPRFVLNTALCGIPPELWQHCVAPLFLSTSAACWHVYLSWRHMVYSRDTALDCFHPQSHVPTADWMERNKASKGYNCPDQWGTKSRSQPHQTTQRQRRNSSPKVAISETSHRPCGEYVAHTTGSRPQPDAGLPAPPPCNNAFQPGYRKKKKNTANPTSVFLFCQHTFPRDDGPNPEA
jgi:hypothetical protein